MALLFWIWTAHACLTEPQVRDRVCWAMCRRDGADTGHYVPKGSRCVCGVYRDYQEITDTTLNVTPPKPEK